MSLPATKDSGDSLSLKEAKGHPIRGLEERSRIVESVFWPVVVLFCFFFWFLVFFLFSILFFPASFCFVLVIVVSLFLVGAIIAWLVIVLDNYCLWL